MKLLAAYSVAKRTEESSSNEDAFGLSHDGTKIALSDGASESYDPALWARKLVDQFIRWPRFHRRWVDASIRDYEDTTKRSDLPWYAEAALERGSFATLLAVCHDPSKRRAVVFAIGDSLAVLADGTQFVRSFPYNEAEQFKANPTLLSTRMDRNEWLKHKFSIKSHAIVWRLDTLSSARLLLMTDALGAWLLESPWHRVPVLLRISNEIEFAAFVENARANREMRRDYLTLLVLEEGGGS